MASSPGLLRFDATAIFRHTYQRNNKKGGQKNLRCFPNCCNGLHAATGFCGGPVAVHLDAPDATKSYLLLAEFVPLFKGAPQSTLSIGNMYALETLRAQANKDADPLVPYFAGHNMQTSYYFNPAKKGWHYGWMSNKHASDREHVLCVHVLEEVSESFAQCLDSLASPPFTVHCRRRSKTDSPVAAVPVAAKKRPHSPSSSVTAPSSPSSDDEAGHAKRQMLAPASTIDWKDDDESLCIDALFQSEVLDLITNSTYDFGMPAPQPLQSTEATLWDTLMDDDEAELLDVLLPTPSAPPMTDVPRYQTYFTPQRNAAPALGRKRPARIPVDLKYPNGPPPASTPAIAASPDAPTVVPMPACRRHEHHDRRRRSHSGHCDDAGPPVAKSCGLLWSIVQLAFCLTMFVHFVGHIFFPTYNAYGTPPANNVVGTLEKDRLTPFLVDCPPPSMTCVRDGFGLQELASCVHHIADRCATEATATITMYSIDGNTTQLACDGMTACASQLQAFLSSAPAPMGAAELEHHKEHYRREHEQQIYVGMQYKFILFMALCTLISFLALQRSFQKCLKKCQWYRHRRLHPDDHIA